MASWGDIGAGGRYQSGRVGKDARLAKAMSDRYLLIKAKGGLGNRMLSAVSGLVYADLTGRLPLIDWRDGSYAPIGENAYPQLFDTPLTQPVELYDDRVDGVDPPIWSGALGLTPQAMIDRHFPHLHSSATVYRRLCTDLSRLDAPAPLAVFWCYLPKFGRLAPHMRRDPRFQGRPLDEVIADYLGRYFTPNARVREAVADLGARLAPPVIGVHVRYTDRKIPLAPLKTALRRELERRPGATVFLATDNGAVQAEFAAEFPNVQYIDKQLRDDGSRLHLPSADPGTRAEAENALIDMHLLARCDHLIYSKHSTFSVAAALIGRLPAERQTDVDRLNPKVVAKRFVQNHI